jgi:hypothetical protein
MRYEVMLPHEIRTAIDGPWPVNVWGLRGGARGQHRATFSRREKGSAPSPVYGTGSG